MKKKNIIIYGAGNNFLFSYFDLSKHYNIVAVVDGNPTKLGKIFFEYEIRSITDVIYGGYDMVVVTPANNAGIRKELRDKGIDNNQIIDLQSALNMIPDDEWEKCEEYESEIQKDSGYAIIYYGGIGDLLIGRAWARNIIQKYKQDGSLFQIYVGKDLEEDGMMIFRDVVPHDNIHIIDADKKSYGDLNKYSVVFRFCILPEVWHRRKQEVNISNSDFLSYVDRLDRYGKENYNRGFFTSKDFCKTVRKQLIERQGIRYHTAYDVFGEMGGLAISRINIIDVDKENTYLVETKLKGKKYITLNTGLNKEYLVKKNTRAWAFKNWERLALKIKENYPDLLIVQIGIRMRAEDDIPADIHLNGMTNFEQISILLKHAQFHIDYDGGLVHVRHMFGGQSIVLMGPSAEEKHAYPENIYIQTSVCVPCEWKTPDWLSVCPKGYEFPLCMESITVEMVMEKIEKLMDKV